MNATRQQDVAARGGGEKFILLLTETDLQEAAALAEALCGAIAADQTKKKGRTKVSFALRPRQPE